MLFADVTLVTPVTQYCSAKLVMLAMLGLLIGVWSFFFEALVSLGRCGIDWFDAVGSD